LRGSIPAISEKLSFEDHTFRFLNLIAREGPSKILSVWNLGEFSTSDGLELASQAWWGVVPEQMRKILLYLVADFS
jgi:hypothetical protein